MSWGTFDWSRVPLAQSEWRSGVVLDAAAILIRQAEEGEPITYTDLAEELLNEFNHPIKPRKDLYGGVAGALAQAIELLSKEWGTPIPPIHVILVNKRTLVAGEGAVRIAPHYFEGKPMDSPSMVRAQLESAELDVYDFARWPEVARALGVSILPPRTGAKDAHPDAVIPLPRVGREGGAPESPAHRALKAWVAAHPEEFEDYGAFQPGTNEHLLSSGDRLDAYFDDGARRLGVEVKTSACSEDELKRGVYQAVKYKAVLRAEQKSERRVPDADSVLVCTRKPARDTLRLIEQLNVRFQLVPIAAERA